ncbi:MAG: hypothetical protein H0X34_07300 [Chthoniobacterales bacterium]|nr:hypothetical protein [Chthoniobacterales bacterium]
MDSWDAAYDSPSRMAVPAGFQAVLAKNIQAASFFETLDRQNTYDDPL